MGNLDLIGELVKDPNVLSRVAKAENCAYNIREQLEFAKDYQKLGTAAPQWQAIAEFLRDPTRYDELDRMELSDRALRLQIYADPMLPKVFHNLIEDSIRYSGKPVAVKIDCHDNGNDLIITYEDDGQGVPLDEKEKLFKKGYGKGTGLGLFLSKEILSITGISIRETGEPGKGARFEMLI